MSAELAARVTAAAAVLAGYFRSAAEGADVAGRALWAARLADMLAAVLEALGAGYRPAPQPPGPAGQLEEIRLVLEAFDWETDDRQYALEQIDDIVNGRGAQRSGAADIAWDKTHPDPYASWVNGAPPAPEPDACRCGHPGADHNVIRPGAVFPCSRCGCEDFDAAGGRS